MKYRDSIKKANQKMQLSVDQLKHWHLPANPINYAVSYEVISNNNQALSSAINQQLAKTQTLDAFFIETHFKEYVLGQSKFRDEIIDDLDGVLDIAQKTYQISTTKTRSFIDDLNNNISTLSANDLSVETHKKSLAKIKKSALHFETNQQKLLEQINAVQTQSQQLRDELEQVRQEIYLDPITGVYNRKGMTKHLDVWYQQNANKKIALIAVTVDQFTEFKQRFGALLSDVILAKIASKIDSYVNKSGLPVRTGGDEFIVLLPDVEEDVAHEIAEKIRAGVEKLQFVSVQSGIRLPKMSVSLGVASMRAHQSATDAIDKALLATQTSR